MNRSSIPYIQGIEDLQKISGRLQHQFGVQGQANCAENFMEPLRPHIDQKEPRRSVSRYRQFGQQPLSRMRMPRLPAAPWPGHIQRCYIVHLREGAYRLRRPFRRKAVTSSRRKGFFAFM